MADSSRTVDNNDLTDFAVAKETVSSRDYQVVKVDVGDVGATSRLVRGQQAKADSLPVTLASDEDTVNVAVVSGGGTQYTEDAAAVANPVGNAQILIRDDALSGQTTTDGDNVAARGTDKGELYVKHADDVTIADGGNSITIDGTVTANLSATDNAVLDSIDSAVNGTLTVGSHAVTNAGTFATQATLQTGSNAIGKLAANTGVDIGDVDVLTCGTITPGTAGSNLGKAEDAAHGSGDVGVMALAVRTTSPANKSGTNGDYEPLQINAGRLWCSSTVQGGVAHDGADSGNPVKLGGRAQDQDAQPDEVANDDRVDALFDRNGYLRVRGDMDVNHTVINNDTSGNNQIVAAQAAGKRIAVWSVMCVADGTVDVRFESGANGTAITGQIPLLVNTGFTYTAGGVVPLWIGAAATNLNMELSANVFVHGHVSWSIVDD